MYRTRNKRPILRARLAAQNPTAFEQYTFGAPQGPVVQSGGGKPFPWPMPNSGPYWKDGQSGSVKSAGWSIYFANNVHWPYQRVYYNDFRDGGLCIRQVHTGNVFKAMRFAMKCPYDYSPPKGPSTGPAQGGAPTGVHAVPGSTWWAANYFNQHPSNASDGGLGPWVKVDIGPVNGQPGSGLLRRFAQPSQAVWIWQIRQDPSQSGIQALVSPKS